MKQIVFAVFVVVTQVLAITDVGGTIATNTVWGPTGNPPDSVYNIVSQVLISPGITLTIQPGVRIQSHYYGFSVTGRLIANGTAQDSILFTSNCPTPNVADWPGISFYGPSDSSHFSYCIIEYAQFGLDQCRLVSVRNSLIRYCTAGISYIDGGSFSDNEITNNATAGITVHWVDTLPPIIRYNVISNNPYGIYVNGGIMPCYIVSNYFINNGAPMIIDWNISEITEEMTWNPAVGGVECVVWANIVIAESGKLTITPGNTFKMHGQITVNGQFVARGTADSVITFTSDNASPNPGDWYGIWFDASAIDSSIIDHCIIEYGRGITSLFATPLLISHSIMRYNQIEGIYCSGNITIDSCQISNNLAGIIYSGLHTSGAEAHLGANIISDNDRGILIGGNKLPVFHAPNQFFNNTHDIYIDGSVVVLDEYLWDPAVDSVECYVNYTLTIDTSGTFIIAPGNRFRVYDAVFVHGRLIARGTETSKITFTSQAPIPTPSSWGGIVVCQSSDSCILSNCIIESAYFGIDGQGRFRMDSCLVTECNIGIAAPNADITINACQISNHTSYGIWCDGGPDSLLISNNTITNNRIGINCEYGALPVIVLNEIYDNSEYGVFNTNNYWIYAENNWWGDSTGPCDTSDIDTLYNPSGLGDRVSDHVDYDPWIGFIGCEEYPTNAPAISGNIFYIPKPNPFSKTTTLSFDLADELNVKCVIYNALGQDVRDICDERRNAGQNQVLWDGRDNKGKVLPAGVYWCCFETPSTVAIKKIVKLE